MRTSLFDPFTEIDLPLADRRDGKVRVPPGRSATTGASS